MRTELIDDEPDTQREDEDARAQRWEEFTLAVKCRLRLKTLAMVLHDVSVAYARVAPLYTLLQEECQCFAETEGWDGVLSAIARAMREDEQARRELMDRR